MSMSVEQTLSGFNAARDKEQLDSWLAMQSTTNKYKAKKILCTVAETNTNFRRFLLQNNISEVKPQSFEEDVWRKVSNSSVMTGFTQYFEKIEKQKQKQFDKQMDKVYEQFHYYGFNSKQEKEIKVKISIPNQRLSRISDDLIKFQEKHGKFSRITNQNRVKSKAIDNLCLRLGKRVVDKN